MAEAAQIVAKVGISRSPVVALDLDPQFCFSCLGLVAALGITDNGHARTCVRNIAG